MRHRHQGKYKSRTPKGRTVLKRRPIHSQMNKFKELTYKQLKKKFDIPAYADDDKDGILNKKDCRPWDKKRQDNTRITNKVQTNLNFPETSNEKITRELKERELFEEKEIELLEEQKKIEDRYNIQIDSLNSRYEDLSDESLYYDPNIAVKDIFQGISTKEDINKKIVGLINQRDDELDEIKSQIKVIRERLRR